PLNNQHVVVGERNGDATPFDLNRTGVWESFDNGDTWKLAFSPLTQAGCVQRQSQAVPALLFTPVGTLLIGTACGVGRRETWQTSFDFSASPLSVSVVKAFAMSGGPNHETIVWARADNGPNTVLDQLLISDGTDGASWTTVGIPSKVEGWGIGYSAV